MAESNSMSEQKLKVGDVVWLSENALVEGPSRSNPQRGTPFECSGVVTNIFIDFIKVRWDSGRVNLYNSLDLITSDQSEYNSIW